jgi:hypothetical protein
MNDYIERDGNGLFVCPICLESFRALAYHTRQVHDINARKLREMFGLPYNYQLQVTEIKEKRRDDALKNRMDEQLKIAGEKTRFQYGINQSQDMIKKIKRGHIIKIRKIRG